MRTLFRQCRSLEISSTSFRLAIAMRGFWFFKITIYSGCDSRTIYKLSLQLQFLKYWKTIQKAFLTKIAGKDTKHKDNLPEVFYKVDALKNFVKFTRKYLHRSIFSINLQTEALQLNSKVSLAQMFLVGFAKFVRTGFIEKTTGTRGIHKDLQKEAASSCFWTVCA